MHSSYTLNVSSRHAAPAITEPTDSFVVPLDMDLHDVRSYKIALTNANWLDARPHIHSYNNKVYFTETATEYVATLTTGFYNASTLATEVAAQMTAAGSLTYTCTYDSVSGKLTVSATGSFFIRDGVNNAYEQMGFPYILPSSAATSLVAPYTVDLSGAKYVDIATNLTNARHASGNNTSVFCRVPLTGSPGGYVNFEPTPPHYMPVKESRVNRLYIRLTDDQGNPYEIGPRNHVSLTFQLDSGQAHGYDGGEGKRIPL